MGHDLDWVILDAGNVLVGLDMLPFLRLLAGPGASEAALPGVGDRYFAAGSVLDRYERGEVSTPEFLGETRRGFAPHASEGEIRSAFLRIIVPWPETPPMLHALSRQVRLGVLSDTSPLHFQHGILPVTGPCVDVHALSFGARAKKPEPAIYRHFLALADGVFPANPSRCLFIDDKPENVEGARRVGLLSEVAKGPRAVRQALVRYGLQPDA